MAVLPDVSFGLVLGWPCPSCERWERPARAPCGCCYFCVLCGHVTHNGTLVRLYTETRSFMPRDLRYERDDRPPPA